MAGNFIFKADPFCHKDSDTGYRVAWRHKSAFQKGHFDEELTYGEATQKAAQLSSKEPRKVFWAEMIMQANFEH